MPQSLSSVYIHVVFSTIDRRPFLADPAMRDEMHRYLAGISKSLDCPALEIGGPADHVHVLARFGRGHSQSEYVKELKRVSSIWAKDSCSKEFAWQAGFGAFSVSYRDLESVGRYVRDQERQHSKESFQDEFRKLLTENGLEWDEKYVWG